jgi:FecR protein
MSDELDAELRARLSALAAAAEDPPLSLQHERRLVDALVEEQRKRRTRRFVIALAGAVAIAAAGLVALLPRSGAPEQTSAHCSLPTAAIARVAGGKQRVALAAFGELVASPEAQLRVTASGACALTLQLANGTLAGDLHDLRPAELHVETTLGRVVVRGTRFSVTADAALEVVLLSGKVDVEAAKQPVVTLRPAQVLRRTQLRDQIIASAAPHAERIRVLLSREVSLAPAASEPVRAEETSAAGDAGVGGSHLLPELLERAEAERKRGNLARARELYELAVRRRGENGEVALLRWTRLELGAGDFQRAEQLLARHARQFRRGKLRAEAAWLEIEVLRAHADIARARERARALVSQYPETPQADAARAWLSAP